MASWSLRARLMTVIFGISVIALALFGLMAYKSMHALRAGKEDLTRAAAKGLLDKIDRNLFERYGDVQAFALSEPARSGDAERLTAFMNDMMPTYAPIYDLMIVVNNIGRVVAVNTLDKNGKPIDTSALVNKDYSGESWFKAAVSGEIKPGTSFVEDLHIDSDIAKTLGNRGRVMNFTAPIRDKETGEILGVWTNRVSWSDVIEAISSEETKELISEAIPKVFVYLVDQKGTYLLHPEGEQFELIRTMEGATSLNSANVMVTHREVSLTGFSDLVVEAVASSRGYSTYPGKGWRLAVQVPEKDPQVQFSVILIIVALAVLILGSLVGYLVIRSIVKTLIEVNGELSKEATSVKETSGGIASASQNLAQASTEQASALQETAASIEETNAMIKKNSENANRSRQVATASYEVANRGKSAAEQMVQAMEDINHSNTDIMRQIEDSNRQITEITKVITEIGNKTKVINEIVFQTKLLSFNASVEAARAGEHGKGFAVVAEEVGNLAQMSGNAAKEISDMLSSSIQKVDGIVNDTKLKVEKLISQIKAKTESGTVVARQCGHILEEVVRNVGEVNVMISEISTATQEQALGISEINKAMNQLDHVTHENATTSQQAANSSIQLSNQAESLFKAVAVLERTILGDQAARSSLSAEVEPMVTQQTNVLALKRIAELRDKVTDASVKRARGVDFLPSEDDPRFKDI